MISNTLAIIIVIEVLFTLFIAWGIMHEDKFVAFEDALFKKAKKKINRAKRNICAKWLAQQGIIIPKQ
jgi:hypothetical protein